MKGHTPVQFTMLEDQLKTCLTTQVSLVWLYMYNISSVNSLINV